MNSAIKKLAQKCVSLCNILGFDPYIAAKARWERTILRRAKPKGPFRDDGLGLFFETRTLNAISKTGRDFAAKLDTISSSVDLQFDVVDTTLRYANRIKVSDEELANIIRHQSFKCPFRKIIFFGGVDQTPVAGYSIFQELFFEFGKGVTHWRPHVFTRSNAVCVFSDFCKDLAQRAAPFGFPIVKIRYPFIFPEVHHTKNRSAIRRRFKLPNDAFAVFFNFSWGSSIIRKNPEALAKAFSAAFPKNKNVWLVLKTTAADLWKEDVRRFLSCANSLGITDRLRIIDENLQMDEVLDLTAAMDIYASLHRGEGLGLGMLEAMSLGVPIVATAYGGNMDFVNAKTAFPIPFTLQEWSVGCGFPRHMGEWAEVDIAAAASTLKALYDNPELGREHAAAGLAFVRDYYSLENFKKDVLSFLGGD